MKYSIEKLSLITHGKLIEHNSSEIVRNVVFDSRSAGEKKLSLFIAIKGKNNDGHDYISDVFKKGIRNFIVEDKKCISKIDKNIRNTSNFILVKNSIDALQKIAAFHRSLFKKNIIGITGSNGKTIVKEWLYHLFYKNINVCRNPKSYNSQLGVPLSLLDLNSKNELGIFEAGISQRGEMKKLAKIMKPEIGIFTNIGDAHQQGFDSLEQKIDEKLQLFKECKHIFYCNDHVEIDKAIKNKKDKNFFKYRVIKFHSWSKYGGTELSNIKIKRKQNSTTISGIYHQINKKIEIPFTDSASIENAIHCWFVALSMGVEWNYKDFDKQMMSLEHVEMRLEFKEGINNCTLINDTYNSDINSLTIALDMLTQQKQNASRTLILSDMLQSGKADNELYEEIAQIVESKDVNKIIGIGNSIKENATAFKIESSFFNSTDEFLKEFDFNKFNDEAILIKGAREFCFEKITNALQKKVHKTVLEINLNSIINNLNVYRNYLKPKTKVMAMVKAFSYGSGSYEIANILQFHNVDYLAVAYADEGAELRDSGITIPIMVMNPEKDSFKLMFDKNLEPEIYNFLTLNELIDEYNKNDVKSKINIHLKFDTGMHRLGFEENELINLYEILNKNSFINVKSVFTHLTSTDNPEHDEFTKIQVNKFKNIASNLEKLLGHSVIKHVLNSVGVIRFSDSQLDMVRLGIGLYGIDCSNSLSNKLENVSSFKTSIS
ncbi:MAG: bifunctional UDP-N-acetylmuramoyl-tripeptide:D-alanyl-D-alanine ligase/alanine racemase, partial [Bacteroidota bacterium]|nr:bifunctional UDP-N-acetylmuramoyl-tripeptide:D-alanyl-D-alanine ligase/alanine racemase [Bacteroidota bacterium]